MVTEIYLVIIPVCKTRLFNFISLRLCKISNSIKLLYRKVILFKLLSMVITVCGCKIRFLSFRMSCSKIRNRISFSSVVTVIETIVLSTIKILNRIDKITANLVINNKGIITFRGSLVRAIKTITFHRRGRILTFSITKVLKNNEVITRNLQIDKNFIDQLLDQSLY